MTVELVPTTYVSSTQSSLDLVPPAYELAEKIARTEFVPAALRGKPEAVLAAILTGHELGIGPMQSLAKIHVIDGRPSMAAELMRALVLAAGHDIWVEESNATRCKVGARRVGSDRESTFTWTMDDAKRAGLDGRQNWRKYPRAMLLARATSEAIRAVFPDVVAGVSYSSEELTDGDMLEVDDLAAVPAPTAPTRKRRARAAATAAPAPAAVAPAPPAAPAAGLPPLPGEEDEIAGGVPAPSPGDGESEGPAGVASPGPSSPPEPGEGHGADVLPPDDGPALPLQSRVAIWCNDAGLDDDGRHRFLVALTNGRISSAKDVTADMIDELRSKLDQVARGELVIGQNNDKPALLWAARDHEVDRADPELLPNWKSMKVSELAAACRERGIEPEGTKTQLIELLEAAS